MTDSLNKLIEDGVDVNVNIPIQAWVGLALAVGIPGIIITVCAQAFRKL